MATPSKNPRQSRRSETAAPKPAGRRDVRPQGEDPLPAGAADETPAPRSLSAEERWQMVARAAYFRAERRGFAAGSDLEDWLEAEREIDALLGP